MTSPQEQEPSSRSRSNEAKTIGSWYAVAGVGFEFGAAIGLCGVLGWYLDKKWQTSPWLLLAGIVVGFTVGLYLIIKVARRSFHD